MSSFECFSCMRVTVLSGPVDKCPSCGSANGQVVSADRLREGFEAGVYYNIDPKTGGRAKKRKR